MTWTKMKLGDVLINREGRYKPGDIAIKNLKRIDKINFSGKIFLSDKGSNTDMILVKKGDLVISGINVEKGAIAIYEGTEDVIATIHYSSYIFNTSKIDIDFLKVFLRSPDFIELLKDQVPGGIKTEIKPKHILPLQVFFPSTTSEQSKIAKDFFEKEKKIIDLNRLLTYQLALSDNLNQTILRDAVQGNLIINENKNEESVDTLLKRIKATLNSNGKVNTLQPIQDKEIPFEIPSNWKWARLGETGKLKRGKSKHRPRNDERLFDGGEFPFIQTGDVAKAKNNNDLITTINGYYNNFGLSQSEMQSKGTLCITIAANIAECGFLDFDACVPDSVVCFQSVDKTIELYAYHYLKLAKADLERFAPATAQKNINLAILNDLIIPFPPLSEQKRIVLEIEKQLFKVKQLQDYITANQNSAQDLLKAYLHQVFAVNEKSTLISKTKIIEFKPTNVDYYRRTVLAAEIVWQLHKEPTLGHLKLQKLIYLCQKSTEMQLPTNFLRQAMGPYDNKLMRSIDKQFIEKNWFEYKREQVLKYQPLAKAGQHHDDFLKYFSTERDGIQFIIDKFKTIKSDVVEIVATLYACIENIHADKMIFSEALLVQRFYEWSEEKKKFNEEQVKRVFSRMVETGIVPTGLNIS